MLYSKLSGMLLTERRLFTTLWSSVMSVDSTLLCAIESFGQSCEKIQTRVHFHTVRKNTAHVQEIRYSPEGSHLVPWTSVALFNTALK